MPNRRKPTEVLRLSGAFDKDPKRLRNRLATPRNLPQIGNCPVDRLSEIEKKAWSELVANAPRGVITNADSHTVEITAVLLAAFWELGASMKTAQLTLLFRLLGSIGCVPSERHKVEVCETNPGSNNRFLND